MAEIEFNEKTLSRKKSHSKKSDRSMVLFFFQIIIVAVTINLLLDHQWKTAIIFFVLTLPILLKKWMYKYVVTISVLFFILKPLLWSAIFLIFAALTMRDYLPETLGYYYILVSIPLISSILMWMNRSKEDFLKKSKVSLEINGVIFMVISLCLVIYAYGETNFKYLSPFIDLENVAAMGFRDRDAFNYLSKIFSFPFLVSTAVCKCLLAIIMHRKEM